MCIRDSGNISLAIAFVAGKNRVPNPAAGIIAFLTFCKFIYFAPSFLRTDKIVLKKILISNNNEQ